MWCVIWKNNSDLYTLFTNTIFETEKKAKEFKDKQTQFRKKHDARVAELDEQNDKRVNKNEIK